MKIEFWPYYLSRAALSIIFAMLVSGFHWTALPIALVLFGLFTLYLHSGWFTIDRQHPLAPLRRDTHAKLVQRKALIVAVVVGVLVYLVTIPLATYPNLRPVAWALALPAAVVTYFITQFILLARA